MKIKNLAKDAIVTLKALKLEFEKFWTNVTVLKKLCNGKPKLKREAQPKLRFQNENFIVAPSPSTAKDYYIQKKYKDAFDSIIQCLEERFDQNTARKKKVSLKEDFFMEMSSEKTFSMILQIFQFPKTS